MELFTYASYDHYRRIQTETNAQKIANVWANKDDIRLLADYLKTHLRFLKFGICHGTRRGAEQAAGPTEPFGASFEEHRALVPDGYAIRDTVSSISTVCGEHRKHLIITQAGCAFNLPPAQSAPSVPEALALGAAPAAPPSPCPSEPAQCGPPPGKTFLP